MVEATQGIPAPTQEGGDRTSDKTMATTLIGAHGLEHIYALSFPVLVTAGLINDDNRKCDVGDVACLEHEAEKH